MALAPANGLGRLLAVSVFTSLPRPISHTRIPTQLFDLFQPLTHAIAIPAISISIPGLISDIWEGILRAVPKKKTSHMKKRHRQLAGKALKDVRSVVSCPGCGKPKKAHHLCPYCMAEIQQGWKNAERAAKGLTKS